MVRIKITDSAGQKIIESETGGSLLNILRESRFGIYTPCGGKGTCGKCRVKIAGEGFVLACRYIPENDIEVILPGKEEANILVHQTEYLENVPYKRSADNITENPVGIAIDIGTTTVVMFFLNMHNGHIEKISSFVNPQKLYGADVISRINYCQENKNGLSELRRVLLDAINNEIQNFVLNYKCNADNFERVVIAGNTTMLHILLEKDPLSIALAPFTPKFTDKQLIKGDDSGLNVNPDAEIVTLPCVSAYVGADIVAGLAAMKSNQKNYLFLDIGTNGEIALVKDKEIFSCATAAGPAFEGANISCGMAAVSGAISVFHNPDSYEVIAGSDPNGICGSGIVDIVAYLFTEGLIDDTGFLKNTFVIDSERSIHVTQEDIREIQLAKSAIYSGVKILMKRAGLTFDDIGALYLAGGFGNYINISSGITIGLLPSELTGRIFPVGNSAGIGALQFLKSKGFERKTDKIISATKYIELSTEDEFTLEFASNMNFDKSAL